MHEKHHHQLYHRMMPYIAEAHMTHPNIQKMDERTLDHLAWKVVQDSGVLHDMPPEHTEETMRDLSKAMLLAYGAMAPAVHAMAHDEMEPAAEAMSPLLPFIWPFFFYPFPFFPGHRGHFRHHHHRHGGHRGPRRGGRR